MLAAATHAARKRQREKYTERMRNRKNTQHVELTNVHESIMFHLSVEYDAKLLYGLL